jgi:hypothetical protein
MKRMIVVPGTHVAINRRYFKVTRLRTIKATSSRKTKHHAASLSRFASRPLHTEAALRQSENANSADQTATASHSRASPPLPGGFHCGEQAPWVNKERNRKASLSTNSRDDDQMGSAPPTALRQTSLSHCIEKKIGGSGRKDADGHLAGQNLGEKRWPVASMNSKLYDG